MEHTTEYHHIFRLQRLCCSNSEILESTTEEEEANSDTKLRLLDIPLPMKRYAFTSAIVVKIYARNLDSRAKSCSDFESAVLIKHMKSRCGDSSG